MKGPRFLRQSLAARLALVLGLISVLAVVTMGLAIYFLTARYLEDRAQDDLAALADFYAVYSAATAADEARLAAMAPQITSFFAPQAGYDVRLFGTRNGTLLAATHDIGPLPSRAALAELVRRRPALFLTTSYDRPDRLYTARPVLAADGSVMAVVEVSRDMGEVRSFLTTLRLALAAAGGLALLAALLASLLLARQMTRPLHQMESATQTIASGDFGQRLAVASEDEIGRLATSINQMADDLARLEGERREFIAKISHDLRTPLTAIKGTVVNLQDRAPNELQPSLALMEEQADRLTRLVNDLLALSRLQRGELRLRCAATDLAAVARSSAAIAGDIAPGMGRRRPSAAGRRQPARQRPPRHASRWHGPGAGGGHRPGGDPHRHRRRPGIIGRGGGPRLRAPLPRARRGCRPGIGYRPRDRDRPRGPHLAQAPSRRRR
jgi:methyl-accepting chemotaxis protein